MPSNSRSYHMTARDEYHLLTFLPSYYNPKDEKNVKLFGERLREIRTGYSKQSVKYHNIQTQGDLAKILGVSTMTVSRLESGNYIKVPLDLAWQIACVFGVTYHYLLGLTRSPGAVLHIDKDDNIQYDDSGTPKELIVPMVFQDAYAEAVHEALSEYSKLNPYYFETLLVLFNADKETQRKCFEVLNIILGIRSMN